MKLTNFEIESPFGGRTLRGLGHAWDLHSFATFAGVFYDPKSNHLTMDWYVQPDSNPWGSLGNDATGCRLHFKCVKFALIRRLDTGTAPSDNSCLSAISKVDPDDADYRYRRRWSEDDPFRLLFEFEGGVTIEISSDSVELEALAARRRGGCGCPPVPDNRGDIRTETKDRD